MSALVIDGGRLGGYTEQILLRLGARPRHARRVSEALVGADLSGLVSHGIRQLPYYAAQIRRGDLDPARDPEIVEDAGSFLVVDGHRGFGHVVAHDAARLASERAREHRVALVAVRNANHIGRLGEYTELLAGVGQIGLLLVNLEGSTQQVAPFGGIDRRLTNNPISIAVPGSEHPIVIDMALSASAESRVLQAAERGTDVPPGWVLDADGEPSTSPRAYLDGGTLVPVGGMEGGHKGYGLIFLIEIIVGSLSGGRMCGPDDPAFSNGFVLICVEPGADADRPARAEQLIAWVKSSRRRPGVSEILVPGELEDRVRRAGRGLVSLDGPSVQRLEELATSVGLDRPLASLGVVADP